MKTVGKSFIIFLVFSLFSSLVFANSSDSVMRGGERGRRPGERPVPRERPERTAPVANRMSGPRASENRKDRAKPSESLRKSNEKNNAGKDSQSQSSLNEPSQNQGESAPPPDSSSSGNFPEEFGPDGQLLRNENNSVPPEIIFYRGNRTLSDGEMFTLQNVKSECSENGEILLEITFTQSVNPRSFTADSILINGEKISSKTKFSFNKKGDTIKIQIPAKGEQFLLSIQNVESFDGTKIEPVQIDIKNQAKLGG